MARWKPNDEKNVGQRVSPPSRAFPGIARALGLRAERRGRFAFTPYGKTNRACAEHKLQPGDDMTMHWLRDWTKQWMKQTRRPRSHSRRPPQRRPLGLKQLEERLTPSFAYNGGFETGSFSGWSNSGNTAFTSVSTVDPHSGSYSAQLGPIGPSVGELAQSIPTVSGQEYLLSFWLANGTGSNNSFTAYWYTGTPFPYYQTLLSMQNTGAQGYQYYSYYVYGNSSNSGVRFDYYNTPSYFYLDDVSLLGVPAVSVSDGGGTYNGGSFAGSGSVNGQSSLEGVGLSYSYYQWNGSSYAYYGTTAPTASGYYEVQAYFPGSADYTSGSAIASFGIYKANPSVTVSDAGGTYNGGAFPPQYGLVAGVNGQYASTLEGIGLTYSYYQWNGSSYVYYGTSAPTATGSYYVQAYFPGSTDYNSASAISYFGISRATPAVRVSDSGGTYNGGAFAASGSVAGFNGQYGSTLEGVGLTDYYYRWNGSSYAYYGTSAPIAAGSYYVQAYFPGSTDYYSVSSAVSYFSINKATPTVAMSDTGGPYTGQSYPVTSATVTGVPADGIIAQLGNPSLSYLYYQNGAPLASPPSAAGTYAVVAQYAGSANYNAVASAEVGAPGSPGDPLGQYGDSYGYRYKSELVTEVGKSMAAVTAIDVLNMHFYDGPGGSFIEPAPVGSPYSYLIRNENDGQSHDVTLGVVEAASFTITPASSTASISASSVTYNTDGSVAVTVSSAVGTPTGTVSLTVDGGSALVQSLVNGTATFTVPSPSAGSHTLSASYAAHGNFAASSSSGTLFVNQAPTSLGINAPTITYNANGTITLTVGAAAGVPTPTGTVMLSVDGGAAQSATLNGNGQATFTLTSPPAGSHTLLASYAAQGNYASSTATGTLSVTPATTSVTIAAPQVTYNANGVVTVTVGVPSGVPTPSGFVTLTVDGVTFQTLPVFGGQAHFLIPSPSAGNHSLSATYNPTSNYQASSSMGSLSVTPAATSIALNASTITYNEQGTVTVTVSAPAGLPTPTGNVTLTLDNGTPQTATLDSNGRATFLIVGPDATTNPHTLTASYAAQGNYAASSSSIQVYATQSATSVSVSASSVTYNANGIVTVTVSSPDGTPTGDVSLLVDGTTTYTASLAGGQAVFTLPSPAAGDHTLSASFAAQGDFAGSSSDALLHVDQAATSVGLSAPTMTYNADGSVTVTVLSASGTPTGSVSLSVDGGTATSLSLDENGQATFTLSSPSAGDHSLHADYASQGNFSGSTADATLHVNQGPTSVGVTAPSVTYNTDGTVTVTVSSASGTPGGNVSLSVDGGTAQTLALDGSGHAVFTIGSPAAGDHSLLATYAAQGNFAGSSSSATLHVNQAATTVGISAATITYNQDGQITVTVSAPAGVPTPTGNISLSVNGGTPMTQALVGGSATFTLSHPDAGDYGLVVTYAAQGNYAGSMASSTLHVQPADQTINFGSLTSVTYGDSDFALAASSSSGLPVTFTATGNATVYQAGGTWYVHITGAGSAIITAHQAGDNDYNAAPAVSETLSIAQAALTVTVDADPGTAVQDAFSRVYGAADPTFTVRYSGFVNGEDPSVLGGTLSFSTNENQASHIGTYTVAGSGLISANYDITYVNDTIDITPATLTIAANPETKIYGQPDPNLDYTVSGLQAGDMESAVLTGGLTRDTGEDVSTYNISQGSLTSDSDYTIAFTGSNLQVTPATLNITANAQTKVYGQVDPSLTYEVNGLQFSDTAAGVLTGGLTRAPGEHAGSYSINQGTLAANSNYTIAFTAGGFSITPAKLSISADPLTKVYGQSDPALTYQVSGLQFHDTALGVLTGNLARDSREHVGSYNISQASLASNNDYTIAFTGNSLAITPATLTVTANAQSKVYGQNDPSLTYQATGFQFTDAVSNVLSGALSRAAGEHVGSYTIGQGNLASDADYTIAFTANSLSITPATLSVTADPQTKVYGQSDPALTYQVNGLQFADTVSGVLAGQLTRDAGEHVASGPYAIRQGALTSDNDYTIAFTGSGLSITPATLSVTANPQTKVYGQSDPALTYQVSGLQFSDSVASVLTGGLARAAGEHVAGSPYAISQGTLAADTDYTIAFTGNTLTVTPYIFSYQIANDSQTYGSPANLGGALGTTITTHVNGETLAITYSSAGDTATAHVQAGGYVITGALANGTGLTSDYSVTLQNGTLTVNPYAFTYQIANDSQVFGSPANLAADLGTTINTGVNSEKLAITYSSTGDTANAIVGSYPITGTLSSGTGQLSDYTPTLVNGTLTVHLPAQAAAYILSSSATGALSVSGNAVVNVPGGLFVDSNSASAIVASGKAQVNVGGTVDVVGGVSASGGVQCTVTGTPGSTVDPLSSLAWPSVAGLTNYGAVSISGSTSPTLNPGIYTSIQISGQASVTLNPGVYIIEGGGLSVSGRSSLSGTGVTIFNAGSNYNGSSDGGTFGSISLGGNGSINLSAPTSGVYSGVALFQSSANTRAMALGGNGTAKIAGMVYVPSANVGLSGNMQVTGSLVVSTLTVTGNAGAFQLLDGANSSYDASVCNWITNGVLTVMAQDDTGSGLDPNEMNRLGDAMSYLNTALGSFGVHLTWAPAGTAADVTVHLATTTPEGGMADGVLGFTTASNDVYIVSTWNFYTGSDPSQISAGQYDFLTLATHELAHTVGLGESVDPSSVMYEYMDPGTVRRTFTDANLARINTNSDRFMKAASVGHAQEMSGGAAFLEQSAHLSIDLAFADIGTDQRLPGSMDPAQAGDPAAGPSLPTSWSPLSLVASARASTALSAFRNDSATPADSMTALADALASGHDWNLFGRDAVWTL